ALEPRPLESGTPAEARAQPTLGAALKQLVRTRGEEGIGMELRMVPGPAGELRARVYMPIEVSGLRRPMLLYLHGGGFVLGDLDRDEETPPALAQRCGAVVVAVHYRLAPEHPIPAAHEDALAAWQWMIANAGSLGGDPARAAIVGEDAGGNLAVEIAVRASAGQVPRPVHVALISPMASADLTRPSHLDNVDSRPLSTRGLRWLQAQLVRQPSDLGDPRFELVGRGDLGGLPPTTIVLPGIAPRRSEGEALADTLRRSGVWVDATVYDGVTAQFFGLARIVNKAMFAQAQVIRNLKESFASAG